MALQQSLSLSNGILLPEAYLRIYNIKIDNVPINNVELNVVVYKDKTSFDALKPEVIILTHVCSSNMFDSYFSETILNQLNKNIFNQAYQFLKDNIYIDSIDV